MAFESSAQIDEPIVNRALAQIYDVALQALKDMGELYRIGVRRGNRAEVLRAYTITTDHALRFCAKHDKPHTIQLAVKKFTSAFTDEKTSGWGVVMNIDLPVDDDGLLSLQSLAYISNTINEWLKPSVNNVRSPRASYPCRDKTNVAPSKWMAGTFLIDDVKVSDDGSNYSVAFSNKKLGLSVVLKDEEARAFSAPASAVGCRVVIHHSGTVRIMRGTNFDKLYHIA